MSSPHPDAIARRRASTGLLIGAAFILVLALMWYLVLRGGRASASTIPQGVSERAQSAIDSPPLRN